MREASSPAEPPAAMPSGEARARAGISGMELAWIPIVGAALLAIYLPGLGNGLVYDDGFLTEDIFKQYGALFPIKVRMLSYGSFAWIQQLFGEGWWKQRLFNLVLHAGVVLALWALYRELLRHVAPSVDDEGVAAAPYYRSPALGLAIGFFALNPAAVYGVAYLVQRSIVMATLFTVVALWCFARGLRLRKPWLHGLALASYALAILSKEHALLAPLAAVPVYIVVARPGIRRLGLVAAVGSVAVAIAGALLYFRYGEILGKPFDEYSRLYLDQLARLDPKVRDHAYGLSVMNEAWLFFRYGLDWLLPWSGWMSINLRPPFPVAFLTFPQVLGIFGYVAALAGGFWLLLRHRDGRVLLGLAITLPALLFATEFATVWVQDPFALYRSYLWAIGLPAAVFFATHGPSPRVVLCIGGVIGGLLVWQSLDRVISLSTPERAWSDAIEKLPDDPRSTGRFVAYLNRGTAYVDRSQYAPALRDFEVSSRLGDEGMGTFNIGAVLAAQGRHAEALAAFDRAEREGYRLYNLPFQRGLSFIAMGRAKEGFEQMNAALAMGPPSPIFEIALLSLGKTAMQLGDRVSAIWALQTVIAREPRNREARYLLGMAYVMQNEPQRAREVLDPLVRDDPTAAAYYARSLANYALRRKAEALADIEAAMRLGLDNPNVRDWHGRIRALP